MNKDKDYYKILGLETSSDKKEIKRAYRELARKFHPDVNPGNKLYEEKFKEIGEAYSVLVDDKLRAQYHLLRGVDIQQSKKPEQTKQQASKAYKKSEKTKEKTKPNKKQDPNNFENILSGFKDKFSWNANTKKADPPPKEKKTAPKQQKPAPQKGNDITTEVSITIAEAHSGTVRKVNILRTDICNKCKGKRVVNGASCDKCNGKGEISNHKQLNVKIPEKVKEGSKIKISGEGNRGSNGGEYGDLFLLIHIIKSSHFTFDGLHVHCEIPITPTEAALGAEIEVPSVDGYINMKIPAETRSGQKFKLSGEGLPDTNSGKRGDQIIKVKIELPPNITDKEKHLYKELGKLRKYNPREHIIFEK